MIFWGALGLEFEFNNLGQIWPRNRKALRIDKVMMKVPALYVLVLVVLSSLFIGPASAAGNCSEVCAPSTFCCEDVSL